VWRSPSFVSKASVPFLMDTGQPPHAQTEAWPGWAFVRELISPVIPRVSIRSQEAKYLVTGRLKRHIVDRDERTKAAGQAVGYDCARIISCRDRHA
jgi:hypothetical protein